MATTGPLPNEDYLGKEGLKEQVRQSSDQLMDATFRQDLHNLLTTAGTTEENVLNRFTGIDFDAIARKYSTDATIQAQFKEKLLLETKEELEKVLSRSVTSLDREITRISNLQTEAENAHQEFDNELTDAHTNLYTGINTAQVQGELSAALGTGGGWGVADLQRAVNDAIFAADSVRTSDPALYRQMRRDISRLNQVVSRLSNHQAQFNRARTTFIREANSFVGTTVYTASNWNTATPTGSDDFRTHGTNLINRVKARLNSLTGPNQLGFEAYKIVDPIAFTIENPDTGQPLDPARLDDYFEWAVANGPEINDPNLKDFLLEYDQLRAMPINEHFETLVTDAVNYVQANATNDRRRNHLAEQLATAIVNGDMTIPGTGGGAAVIYTTLGALFSGNPLPKQFMAYVNDVIDKKVNSRELDQRLTEYLKNQILEQSSGVDSQAQNYQLIQDPANPDRYNLVDHEGNDIDDFNEEFNAYVGYLMEKDKLTKEERIFLDEAGAKLYRELTNPPAPGGDFGQIHTLRYSLFIHYTNLAPEARATNAERMAEYLITGGTGPIRVYNAGGAEQNYNPHIDAIPNNLLKLYVRHKENTLGEGAEGGYKQRAKEHFTRDLLSFYPPRNAEQAGEILDNLTDRYAELRSAYASHRFLRWRNSRQEEVESARAQYQQGLRQHVMATLTDEFANESNELDILNNDEHRERFNARLVELVTESRQKLIERERAHRSSTLNERIETLISEHPWISTAVALGTVAVAGGIAAATMTAAPWAAVAAAGVAGVVAGGVTWKNVSARLSQGVFGRFLGFKSKVRPEEVSGRPNASGHFDFVNPRTGVPFTPTDPAADRLQLMENTNNTIARRIALHDNDMYSRRWAENFTNTQRILNEDAPAFLGQSLREYANIHYPLSNTHNNRTTFIAEMVDTALVMENDLNEKVEQGKKRLQNIRMWSDILGGVAGAGAGYGAYNTVGALGSWINGLFAPNTPPPVTSGGGGGGGTTPGTWNFKVPDDPTSIANFADEDPGLTKIFQKSLGLTPTEMSYINKTYFPQIESMNSLAGRSGIHVSGIDFIKDGETLKLPANMLADIARMKSMTLPQVQTALTFP